MPRTYSRILAAVMAQPWAILESRLADICAVLAEHVQLARPLTAEEVRARLAASVTGANDGTAPHVTGLPIAEAAAQGADGLQAQPGGSIAVIPIIGIAHNRAHQIDEVSGPGGFAAESVAAAIGKAAADPGVLAIVLDVDSPGGQVSGIPELAAAVARAAAAKPTVAQINALAASAAYWVASQASEIALTPSAEVGSIGVFAIHQDLSRAFDEAGVTHTLISAGKFKTEANPFEPLSADARDEIQRNVDRIHGDFIKAVARGRGVSPSRVRSDFGQGRLVDAAGAIGLGMADRIATLGETISRLATPRGRAQVGKARAAAGPGYEIVAIPITDATADPDGPIAGVPQSDAPVAEPPPEPTQEPQAPAIDRRRRSRAALAAATFGLPKDSQT